MRHDKFWSDVAEEIRQARKLRPLGLDDIDTELQSTLAQDLTDERISNVLAFATSRDSLPSFEARFSRADAGVVRLLNEVSSSGLVSSGEIRELYEEKREATVAKTPSDYVSELTRRNLLHTCNPDRVGQEFEKGLLFSDYLLLDMIGIGGMGEVFRALHLRMDRIVALKVLPSKASRLHQNRRRFDDEIKALAKLNHANIVTAYDAGELGGVPYLVLEYIDGSDLAQLVDRIGPLKPQLALDYVLQAARGLNYAHSQRIIHRDVKPSNILVDRDGVVKISDLGLAKLVLPSGHENHDATAPGTTLGTYSYISPEQAAGSGDADARSDIYSLGCTLFFLLFGRSPAAGPTNEAKLRWHREAVIPSLRTYLPGLPERLDAIFQRMLAKSPSNRPQSMVEVIEELEACQELCSRMSIAETVGFDGSTVDWTENRDTPAVPASKPVGRKWRTQLRWLVIAVLVAVIPIGLAIYGNSDRRRESPTVQEPAVQEPAVQEPTVKGNAAAVADPAPPAKFINTVAMNLTRIPAGKFLMGAPVTENGSLDWERPQHLVEITQPFYMGTHEVNRRQYYLVMDPTKRIPERQPNDAKPAVVDAGALPIVEVTWDQAVEFCRLLSQLPSEQRAGRTYRLPTEAEWEYCCRAGTVTAYSTGNDLTKEQANFGSEWRPPNTKFAGAPRLLEIGSFPPNPFGLHDMHGNALEWCKDRYGAYHPDAAKDPQGAQIGDQRIVRGGATTYKKAECRSASRRSYNTHETSQFGGFRVVCNLKTE